MEVPQELRDRHQWIVWRNELRYGKPTKVPYQVNGRHAKTNDPATWSSFEAALAVVDRFDGLGFVFSAEDPFFGLDLDGCRNPETGELAEWAACLLNEFKTYAELSPSGTGVKLFGVGSVPGGTGRKKELTDEPIVTAEKRPGIEAYDRGRYFAFTGERFNGAPLEVRDCQAALNSICDIYWPVTQQPTRSAPSVPLANVYSDAAERASKYLQRVPPAISGQGGHNRTYRVACVLVLGFNLSPEAAFPVLSQWNAACEPPWSDKELWHKLFDADKLTGPRGWLLESGRGYEGPDVDLRAFLESINPASPPVAGNLISVPAAVEQPIAEQPIAEQSIAEQPIERTAGPLRLSLEQDLLAPGLIGEIVRHNLRTALYPQPELAFAAAISLLAVITGRKVTDERGTRTNIYVLGLAPSGSGKEHARKLNKEILIRAGGEKMLGPERVGSSAGLVAVVSDSPAVLFQLDEIGRLLQTMQNPGKSPHLFNVGTVLMQLYSASDSLWIADAYADLKKVKRINQPHACIYGTAVPDGFWNAMTAENVTDGLLGRLMTFESPGYVPMRTPERAPVPESIIESVRKWLACTGAPGGNLSDQNPEPMLAEYTDSARQRLEKHLTDICERRANESSTAAAVWSRSGEKTAKLALLFACSRSHGSLPTVTLEDVDRAIRIANWLTRTMLRKVGEYVSENETESRSKRVLREITGPMTLTELTRRTRFLRGKERAEILADLQSAGYITIASKNTGGRPQVIVQRSL